MTQVVSPPAKPLMIYDGDCNFCKFWIIRWQQATAGRVDFCAGQAARVAAQFPELPREQLQTAVQFIATDGCVSGGAEAVFHLLTFTRFFGWVLPLYQKVPGVKWTTETAYSFVAKHRMGFSILTKWLWGRAGVLPEYSLTRWVFLRFIGLIYLSAFLSLGTQVEGLIGSNGILPAKQFMGVVKTHFDKNGDNVGRYHALPTLCWFDASDNFLRLLCMAGNVLSLLVIANMAPAICLFLLWIIYLSLVSVGGDFLSFQWDALLLETGFLAIFFAPRGFLPGLDLKKGPSRIMLWLLRWLLFRLMFESGVVKLLSGDLNWRGLKALNFHYETQPLPTWLGWYAHQLPNGFQAACVFAMFVIELAVPFFLFAPRRLRFVGCVLLIALQVCILLTGNYCFFNWLTIALCVLWLDDAFLRGLLPRNLRKKLTPPESWENETGRPESAALGNIVVPDEPVFSNSRRGDWPKWLTRPIAIIVLIITGTQALVTAGLGGTWEMPVVVLQEWVSPFHCVNSYGLFAMMTTLRREIIVEGSNDDKTWQAYEFKYKPGEVKRAPGFVAPHQPRLDWQMWFAALGNYQRNPWFINFCLRLLQGSPDVLRLLEHNPFPDAPPKYIRAQMYDYHFSDQSGRRATGAWWTSELEGEYLPEVTLKDFENSGAR